MASAHRFIVGVTVYKLHYRFTVVRENQFAEEHRGVIQSSFERLKLRQIQNMDTEGCPDGFATDRVFQKNPATLCSTKLAVFWSVSFVICAARLIAFLAKLRHYLYAPKSKRRSQFTLIVSVNSVCGYFLLMILPGVNLANAANGWSFAIYSLTYLSLITDLTMMLFKIVRLGKGVINLPQKEMFMSEVDYLSRFTAFGVMMAMAQILMAIVSTVTLIILSPIMPQNDFLLGTIGFASKAVFQTLCAFGMALQFHRCITAIDAFLRMQKSSNIETLDSSKIGRIDQARKILRQRQVFIVTFLGSVSIVFILLSAAAVPMSWEWVVYATAIPEACGHVLVEFIFNRGRFASKSAMQTNNNNIQEDQLASTAKTDVGSNQEIVPKPSNSPGSVDKTKVFVQKSKFANRRPWKAALSMITEEQTLATTMQSTSRNTEGQ